MITQRKTNTSKRQAKHSNDEKRGRGNIASLSNGIRSMLFILQMSKIIEVRDKEQRREKLGQYAILTMPIRIAELAVI